MREASPHLALAEAINFSWKYGELDLVDWWLWQSEGKDRLKTIDGERLIVLDSGRRNDGPGPDIRDCHILLDDVELCGDVEMHLRAKDWFGHQHHLDPRYHGVILHVVADESQGPEIPTLVIRREFGRHTGCLATHPLTHNDLVQIALERFKAKIYHLKTLEEYGAGLSPLLLGLLEILLAGPGRRSGLMNLASHLGLASWPDNKPWRGSNQFFPGNQSIEHIFRQILNNQDLFKETNWRSINGEKWSTIDPLLVPIQNLGIRPNQSREWLINSVLPYGGVSQGFSLWKVLPVFRHYGCEKQLVQNLGLKQVSYIAEQQALLGWNLRYCKRKICSACPLIRSHQTLTQIN